MISNKRTTDATVEPVTPTELDTHLRGDGALSSNDGTTLTTLITSAREYVEEYTRRALLSQTWTLVMDAWGANDGNLGWWDGVKEGAISQGNKGYIELPVGPLISVTSLSTYDSDNASTVFSSSNYFLDTNAVPGQVILNTGLVWPAFTRTRNGIEIIYVAGYGTVATSVPRPLKVADTQLAAHWYENRELVSKSGKERLLAPMHVQAILDQYRVAKL